MNRDDYLSEKSVTDFVNFLVASWRNFPSNYVHTHEIPTRGAPSKWRKWRIQAGFKLTPTYENLRQARNEYWWNGDYTFNNVQLSKLSKRLSESLQQNSNANLREAIFEVFEWGGVSRETFGKSKNKNRPWVEHHYQNETLVDQIRAGVTILSDSTLNLSAFDGVNLRMNSSFTKVYSLLINGFPIYDGRVGAALGLMVCLWMSKNQNSNSVPPLLAFPWSPGQGNNAPNRNPSRLHHNFPRLLPSNHARHAYWNILAGWILVKTADQLNIDTRELESSLFMIGYKV